MMDVRQSWLRYPLREPTAFGWVRCVILACAVVLVQCKDATRTEAEEPPTASFEALVAAYPEADLTTGRRIFLRQCSVCHQPSGRGASRAIPPLRGHIPHLAAHRDGRSYLARLVLFGLNGPITVNGQKYFNAMPALGALLTDDELAAALNYAQVSWGNDAATPTQALVRPTDLAEARKQPWAASKTLALRKALWPDGVTPTAGPPTP
jgi:mono/diheme cytochrome c family protein